MRKENCTYREQKVVNLNCLFSVLALRRQHDGESSRSIIFTNIVDTLLYWVNQKMDRYQRVGISGNSGANLLGEGTYGVVYKAKDKHTDEFVAMKVGNFQT